MATTVGDRKEIDIKLYAKVEKIPGGELEDCRVIDGVMVSQKREYVWTVNCAQYMIDCVHVVCEPPLAISLPTSCLLYLLFHALSMVPSCLPLQVEKDVTHPKMKKRIERPRILLLDCPLEYKKAESATQLEVRE